MKKIYYTKYTDKKNGVIGYDGDVHIFASKDDAIASARAWADLINEDGEGPTFLEGYEQMFNEHCEMGTDCIFAAMTDDNDFAVAVYETVILGS